MKHVFLVALGIAFLASPSTAIAQDKAPQATDSKTGKNSRFERLDKNKDGTISKNEFLARHIKRFEQADADGNGKLTPEELKAAGKKKQAKQ